MNLAQIHPADAIVLALHEEADRKADQTGMSFSRRSVYRHVYAEFELADRLVRAEQRIHELEAAAP